MTGYFKIFILFIIINISSCYLYAALNRDNYVQSGYMLCDYDTESDAQSEIYQEPVEDDEVEPPADTEELNEDVQDNSYTNSDNEDNEVN